jgi:hypothetical protein
LASGVGAPFDKRIFELVPYLIRDGRGCSVIDKTEPRGDCLNTPELSDDIREQITLWRLQFAVTKPKKSPLNSVIPLG